MTSSETQRLAELFHHRWCVPILAELFDRQGVRVATLIHCLQGSRGAIRQALDFLEGEGWIRWLVHHTHPLAPEYVVTDRATPVAQAASKLYRTLDRYSVQNVAWKKWNIPVLGATEEDGYRFSELIGRIPKITDRALSSALRELETNNLVTREIARTMRSAVAYVPTVPGKTIRVHIQSLADVIT